MEVLDYIPDYRIKATNVLVRIDIRNYIQLARTVIDDNEFQRRRVITSRLKKTLKSDIQKGCTIPPIVLGVRDNKVPGNFNFASFEDNDKVQEFFDNRDLIILDGLQRTFVFLELAQEDPDGEWLDRFIRCEVFIGMEKLGILYRMLTLNTGQTTMSTRHLLEILYFDYLDSDFSGIKLVLDKNDEAIDEPLNEFPFKELIEGYNSFINGREIPIQRADILQNIETINSLERTDDEKEGFKSFVVFFHKLINTLNEKNDFEFDGAEIAGSEYQLGSTPFGKSIPRIFGRSQAHTGLGAALRHLKKYRSISMDEIAENMIPEIHDVTDTSLYYLLKAFDYIRNKSKKVGNDQRSFFKYIFIALFDPESETHLNFESSVKRGRERIDEKMGV